MEIGQRQNPDLTFDDMLRVIGQAAELGAKSIVLTGGEPTLHPRFRDLVSHVVSLRLMPVIVTNTLTMNSRLAKFLHSGGASVMAKLDSLRPQVQDYLCDQAGVLKQMRAGLECLVDCGFTKVDDPRELRLGVSFVANRLNLGEVEDIWRYCRDSRTFPKMEALTPTEKARREMPNDVVSQTEVRDVKLQLLDVDRRHYGYDWLASGPLAGGTCMQHLCSLYVTVDGSVRPCASTHFDEHPDLAPDGAYLHNVRSRSLKQVYDDPLFEYARSIDRHLEGRCDDCEHLDECIGCRGYAYTVGVDEGLDPKAALRGECLLCSR